jgi:hypothetical protein
MVLVSATPYFPEQARALMRHYRASVAAQQWEVLRHTHPGGDAQIEAILASTESFADSYDDMSFTPPQLSAIRARERAQRRGCLGHRDRRKLVHRLRWGTRCFAV